MDISSLETNSKKKYQLRDFLLINTEEVLTIIVLNDSVLGNKAYNDRLK
jgi:hypothetical protein